MKYYFESIKFVLQQMLKKVLLEDESEVVERSRRWLIR